MPPATTRTAVVINLERLHTIGDGDCLLARRGHVDGEARQVVGKRQCHGDCRGRHGESGGVGE